MNFQIDKTSNIESIISQISFFAKSNCDNKNIVTEVVTISSEIIYNIIKYAPSGNFSIYTDDKSFYINASDDGTGFKENVEDAVLEGYSKSNSLGLGIPSIIRMCDDVLMSTSSSGTKIVCKKGKINDSI